MFSAGVHHKFAGSLALQLLERGGAFASLFTLINVVCTAPLVKSFNLTALTKNTLRQKLLKQGNGYITTSEC